MEGLCKPIYLPCIIPRCVKEFARSPPMCHIQERDLQAVEVSREHGQTHGRSSHGILQTCDLTYGSSDIVVILERPRNEESHPPSQTFEDFVNNCDTLKAVNELLRFGSRGT